MCGRYNLHASDEELQRYFALDEKPQVQARYNIAPTQQVAVVRAAEGQRQLFFMRWGMIPGWAQDPARGGRKLPTLINARSETAATKPSFQTAMRRRRCLIPASGYYEWKATETGKQPYLVEPVSGTPLALAGLWEQWISDEGAVIESCTILTTDACPQLESLHPRMPLIIEAADSALWLDPATTGGEAIDHLIRPHTGDGIQMRAVSRHVNHVGNDDPGCLESPNPQAL